MFTEVDSLPGSEVETPRGDRDHDTAPQYRRFQMGGHVVRAFHRVAVIRGVLGDHFIEVRFHIGADGGIGIFVESQRSRCVKYKDVCEAGFKTTDLRYERLDFRGDEMKTA